jgi:putative IMPACT (imprinted ancient) family translation regulator
MNILVVVSRWYGGIHLGTKRFAHIMNVAQITLTEFHNLHNNSSNNSNSNK